MPRQWLSSLTTWSYIQLPFHIIYFLNVLNLIQHHIPNSPSANASLSVSNFLMSVLLIVGSEHRRGHFEMDGIKISATAAALVTGELICQQNHLPLYERYNAKTHHYTRLQKG